MTQAGQLRAPLIAVVGPDGSGKSTVSAHLLQWVGRYGPAAGVHLGKQAGNIGRALTRWPVIGPWIGRRIQRKTQSVHGHFATRTEPDLTSALVITLFTIRRCHRFRRMLRLRQRGFIIVTDRYPQVALPGAYDGPGFPAAAAGNWLLRRLARREYRLFKWMAGHVPDVVVRLSVDLDTACARKPDHNREALAAKIAVTPRLEFNGAPIVDIDAARPLNEVLAAAEAAIAQMMARKGYRVGEAPTGGAARE